MAPGTAILLFILWLGGVEAWAWFHGDPVAHGTQPTAACVHIVQDPAATEAEVLAACVRTPSSPQK